MALLITTECLLTAQAEEPWSALLGAFALVGRHDPRARVADSAASALLDCCCRHAGAWPGHVWRSVHGRAVAYLLDLPFARLAEGAVVRTQKGWRTLGYVKV